MYSSLRFSMMIEEMPARCRSRASMRPAGPAPMIPTCARTHFLPAKTAFAPLGGPDGAGQGTFAGKTGTIPSAGPAVARHAVAVAAIEVAERGFQVAFFAPDHAEVQRDAEQHRHHQHPVGGQEDRQSGHQNDEADIHG